MHFSTFVLALLAPVTLVSAASTSAASKSVAATGSLTASASSASESASLSSLTPCVLGCLTPAAAQSECLTFTNVTCVCTNADFQYKATTCLQAECSASEMTAALAMQSAECGAESLSATGKPTDTAPFLPSNSAADISASAGASGGVSASGSAAASAAATSKDAKSGALTVVCPNAGLAIIAATFAAAIGGVFVL
ncbi:CFEM domain-containing protein [Mycena chlorophos]|uniref:CFEM domain-containing protein n=1 Tax=Mycena chlorophos TaxID=658473 RepID=A0A8H6SV80_MYCCL|nr:CFEM domain-containing protein [Mycena chlorophos]